MAQISLFLRFEEIKAKLARALLYYNYYCQLSAGNRTCNPLALSWFLLERLYVCKYH